VSSTQKTNLEGGLEIGGGGGSYTQHTFCTSREGWRKERERFTETASAKIDLLRSKRDLLSDQGHREVRGAWSPPLMTCVGQCGSLLRLRCALQICFV
jgi:hypothetical protein